MTTLEVRIKPRNRQGSPMTRSQYDQLVQTRTDLIMDDELAAGVFAVHFETQLRRGKLRTLLHRSGRHLARAGAALACCYTQGAW
jgi:hypothetical protein